MAVHLYVSLIPEALIFSELDPDRFGKYLAIGSKRLTSGPAAFFEIDPGFTTDAFNVKAAREKCHPHPDGTPRSSCYAGVYMVLANVPISELGTLYLTTEDGLTLPMKRSSDDPPTSSGLHLYQEICPVQPRVASPLNPREFAAYVTDPHNPVFLPRLAFCELRLDALAHDPENAPIGNLPYRNLPHLRECLTALRYKSTKMTKIVMRDMDTTRLLPMLENGFYVGDQNDFAYYPLPSRDDLETKHYQWFNSANRIKRL